jgi:hypothetical protein
LEPIFHLHLWEEVNSVPDENKGSQGSLFGLFDIFFNPVLSVPCLSWQDLELPLEISQVTYTVQLNASSSTFLGTKAVENIWL